MALLKALHPSTFLAWKWITVVLTLNSGDEELLKLVREQGQLREDCLSSLPATTPASTGTTPLEEGEEREQVLLPEEEEDGGGGVNYEKAVQLMTVGSMHLSIDVAHQCPKLTVHFSLL